MWQQQFTNLAYESTEHPLILESKAPSTLTINRPQNQNQKVLKIYKGKVLLTNQTTNKLHTTYQING